MKDHNTINNMWIGVEQLENDPAFLESSKSEFVELPIVEQLSDERSMKVSANRRDFLKYLGFGLGAATVAASCDIPVKKAIPYVEKPDSIVPGVANYYASSFVNGGDYCSILVKTREGRPIKIEGNTLSNITKGGTSARVQASVLSLYDTNRLSGPKKKEGEGWADTSWAELDKEIAGTFSSNTRIRIVTNTNLSPTAKKAMTEFIGKYPNAQVVTYDAVSSSAILEANQECFGQKVVPNYSFDKAETIVSFGADFLGTWISPIEYARQYAAGRKLTGVKGAKMSNHVQIESGMTLTGSNADNRILVKPSEMGAAIATLHDAIAGAAGGVSVSGPKVNDRAASSLQKLAKSLLANKGKSLVVSGSNNVGEQVLINSINSMLGNYQKTLSFANASLQRQGVDSEIQGLIREMNAGGVNAIIFWGANPAYDIPNVDAFRASLAKVGTKISFAGTLDETTALCDYIAPDHHFLESWGDAEPKRGHFSLIQPTISPLFNTREGAETLLRWGGSANLDTSADQPYYQYLSANWKANMFPLQSSYLTFQAFWDSSLHNGVFEVEDNQIADYTFNGNLTAAGGRLSKPSGAALEIAFFETVNMGAGQYSNNPWLQEMPDPITRCVWGNYLAIPVKYDGDRQINAGGQFAGFNQNEIVGEADKAEIEVNGKKQVTTCIRQFGLMEGVVSLALGYGREVAGAAGRKVGTNAFNWLTLDANGNTQYYSSNVGTVAKAGKDELACVQYHHTMGVTGEYNGETINVDERSISTVYPGYQGSLTKRTIIRQGDLEDLEAFAGELEKEHETFEHLNQQTIYPYAEYKEEVYEQGHHWGLHVDLSACIGCGACQVACVSENNVPVVGKHEVFRHHEMTWLRIDRYFYGDYENPNVVYQPMMCQHCDNAPCENVCPVSATNHSSEGLNQMAYNRCIGTRYCANNCPYKVRRFNWLDYTSADLFPINEVNLNKTRDVEEDAYYMADNLTRMVLNPDVTVRSRGVMEKCSFCVQRIQEGKLTAKREGRRLRAGEVKSACQTACPTGAITFGDMNNSQGELSKKLKNPLSYYVLEEVNTRPSVKYQAKVTNRDEELA